MRLKLINRRIIGMTGKTINIGDHQFERFNIGMEADIPDDMSFAEAVKQMFHELRTESLIQEVAVRGAKGNTALVEQIANKVKEMLMSGELDNFVPPSHLQGGDQYVG